MFAQIILLLSVANLLTAHRFEPKYLGKSELDGRIVGGAETTIEKAPWQVSLQQREMHFCGGAIYRKDIIVTAAHCVYNRKPSSITVRYGSTTHNNGGYVAKVSAILEHEEFSKIYTSKDVAVLLLSSPLQLSAHVKTIPLATSVPKVGAKAIVSGWGRTERQMTPNNLHSVYVAIVGNEECAKAYEKEQISDTTLCAASPGKDACQGDSGGPLVHKNQLVGIVSWGYGCALPDYPGVYASVPALRRWIVRAASKLSRSNRIY